MGAYDVFQARRSTPIVAKLPGTLDCGIELGIIM